MDISSTGKYTCLTFFLKVHWVWVWFFNILLLCLVQGEGLVQRKKIVHDYINTLSEPTFLIHIIRTDRKILLFTNVQGTLERTISSISS